MDATATTENRRTYCQAYLEIITTSVCSTSWFYFFKPPRIQQWDGAGLFTVINEPVAVFIRCGVFVHVFLIVSLKETLLTHYPVNLGCLPPW
jgi:hypothetical protein